VSNGTGVDGFAKANHPDSAGQGRQARFREIAQALHEAIQSGVYQAGDRLPTELELAQQHGVSRVTAAAALSELARAGLVTRTPRRGTIVRPGAQYASTSTRTTIALILPNLEQTHALGLLRGVDLGARAAGFSLLITVSQESHEEEGRAIRDAVAAGAAGMIIFIQDGESYNAEVLRLVLGSFPLVLVDRYLRGVRCALVSSDNVAGSRMLVQELLDAGHRQICVLTRPPNNTSAIEDRIRGYVQALTGAGVPVDYSLHYVVHAPFTVSLEWEPAQEMISHFVAFLQEHPGVTAIYATNAQLALLAYRATQQLHLRIPEDISLVCVDPLEAIPLSLPALTCGIQPADAIGETAVTLLQEAMAGMPPRTVLLPMQLRRAGSVGPLARAREPVGPRQPVV
jgi:DNA-binding LacI/PurR family transcriptional regulator